MRTVSLLLWLGACSGDASAPDLDLDGYGDDVDCNDADRTVHPDAEERCNEVDDNCDGVIDEGVTTTFWADDDLDRHGDPERPVQACRRVDGLAVLVGDCDDQDPQIFPGRPEICDEVDQDCDGVVDNGVTTTYWRDLDQDGYGGTIPIEACELPEGASETNDDCNDSLRDVHPGAEEICNDRDDDCDGRTDEGVSTLFYPDDDFDGYGAEDGAALRSCNDREEGYAPNDDDCDDTTAATNPGVTDDGCDGQDNDCDDDVDEDHKDGWRLVSFGDGVAYEVDTATAAIKTIATHKGFTATTSDVREDGLAVLQDSGILRRFDLCKNTSVDIGPTGAGAIGGISFSGGGRLVGLDQTAESLVTFDLATGRAKTVGGLGILIGNNGLAWDCANNVLYGVDATTDRLFQVDPANGRTSKLVTTSVPFNVVGLEYDATTGHLWAATGRQLYDLDPSTGKSVLIGDFSGGARLNDLFYAPPCP